VGNPATSAFQWSTAASSVKWALALASWTQVAAPGFAKCARPAVLLLAPAIKADTSIAAAKPGGTIPLLTAEQARVIEDSHARKARQLSTEKLKALAEKAKKKPAIRTAQTTAFVRDAAVAEYAKRLAKGICDLCEMPAPFQNRQNVDYLECHHIIWLAKGGDDTIENAVALCPNCHRKMHVLNRKTDKERLASRVNSRAK
jgi:hypothetical protein